MSTELQTLPFVQMERHLQELPDFFMHNEILAQNTEDFSKEYVL
jgi:hypothetical protein